MTRRYVRSANRFPQLATRGMNGTTSEPKGALRDGYEGRVPNSPAGIEAKRSAMLTELVCGSCGHRPAACDCPMSIRPTPLKPMREYLRDRGRT